MLSMFHRMKTAELRRSAEMMEARDEWLRWRWGAGVQMARSSPTSVPHPLSIPAPCSPRTTFPAAALEKTACTIQRKTLLIAFSCRCFREGVAPQAEGRVLRDEPNTLASAVKPRQGKCVRLKRCWKCRQPCRDTQKEP